MAKDNDDSDLGEPGIVTCFRCQAPAQTEVRSGITAWKEHRTPGGLVCCAGSGTIVHEDATGCCDPDTPMVIVGHANDDPDRLFLQPVDFKVGPLNAPTIGEFEYMSTIRAVDATPYRFRELWKPQPLPLRQMAAWAEQTFTRIEPDWFVPHFTVFAAMRLIGAEKQYINNEPLEWWLANWDWLYKLGEIDDEFEAFTEQASVIFFWEDLRKLRFVEILEGPDIKPIKKGGKGR